MSDEAEILYGQEITLVSPDGDRRGRLLAEFSGTDYAVRITYGSAWTGKRPPIVNAGAQGND